MPRTPEWQMDESRFLYESNMIEGEPGHIAFEDAHNAWKLAKRFDGKWSVDNILAVHAVLMWRLNPRIAGQIRKCDVFVGGRKCMAPRKLTKALEEWVERHGKASSFEAIKKAHVAFEKIHPFEDGNGRTGRIIMNAQSVDAGLGAIIIHQGVEQYAYYQWFAE